MKTSAIYLLAGITVFLAGQSSAQLYVGPGSSLYIKSGMPLFADSLVLTPDADLFVSGFTIQKSDAPVTGTGGSSVSKVYSINPPLPFSGTAGIRFNAGDLNGNTASMLQIAYDTSNGFITTTGSTVNLATGYVSYIFGNAVPLARITAVNEGVTLSIPPTGPATTAVIAWPNPVRETLYIRLPGSSGRDAVLQLVNGDGKILGVTPCSQELVQMNMGNLPAGIYFIRYSDTSGEQVIKINRL